MLRNHRRELHEFAVRALQREAMLVFAARGIRPKCRDAAPVLDFDCLHPPSARRAVGFWRQPFLDVPAIHGGVFGFLAQLDDLAKQRARNGIALLEFSANPRQPIPTPYGAIVWFA